MFANIIFHRVHYGRIRKFHEDDTDGFTGSVKSLHSVSCVFVHHLTVDVGLYLGRILNTVKYTVLIGMEDMSHITLCGRDRIEVDRQP